MREAAEGGDSAQLDAISAGFAHYTHGFLPGVVGAVDGILIPIKAPGTNLDRLWYCRKQFYAQNVQAVADSQHRFTHLHCGANPGAMHDSLAWRGLQNSPNSLAHRMTDPNDPIGFWMLQNNRYLIGDEAYPASHVMIVPWPGNWDPGSPELAFNERHSSARIAVESAFGILCRKWLLLKRPFELDMRRTKHSAGFQCTISVAMKLQNLCLATDAESYLSSHETQATDVSGEDETGNRRPRGMRVVDHRRREQALDMTTTLFSSADPAQELAERRRGASEEVAALAGGPAWYGASDDRSPRDPAFDNPEPASEARALATAEIASDMQRPDARQQATDEMRAFGVKRKGRLHWKGER